MNAGINLLAAARVFLFASRDVWFVVGLPVFLRSELGWSFWQVGGFLAIKISDKPWTAWAIAAVVLAATLLNFVLMA